MPVSSKLCRIPDSFLRSQAFLIYLKSLGDKALPQRDLLGMLGNPSGMPKLLTIKNLTYQEGILAPKLDKLVLSSDSAYVGELVPQIERGPLA